MNSIVCMERSVRDIGADCSVLKFAICVERFCGVDLLIQIARLQRRNYLPKRGFPPLR